MSNKPKVLQGIPTNIISGFLGSGKTTMILSLLKNKPKDHNTRITFTDHGSLDPTLLQGSSGITKTQFQHKHAHQHDKTTNASEEPIPACGYLKKENVGEGFRCIGWRFSPKKVFKREELTNCLGEMSVERMKAVLVTDEGVMSYNQVGKALTTVKLNDCQESKIEIISKEIDPHWESRLMACLMLNDQSKRMADISPVSLAYAKS